MSSTFFSDPPLFRIYNEEEAWRFLKKIIGNEVEINRLNDVEFGDWPIVKIRIPGEKLNSSVTAEIAHTFIDIQNALYRSYSLIVHGTTSLRSLSNSDKDKLELVFRIEGGSSNIGAGLIDCLREIGVAAVDKLEAKHVVTILLSLGLLYAGTTTLGHWMEIRKEERIAASRDQQIRAMLETLARLSEIDKANIELLIQAQSELPILAELQDVSHESNRQIIKRLSTEPTTYVNDVEINSAIARELIKPNDTATSHVRLDGNYLILRNDTTKQQGFSVRLQNIETNQVFIAEVQIDLTPPEALETLKAAEWGKTPISAEINATIRDGEIIFAAIIDARPLKL